MILNLKQEFKTRQGLTVPETFWIIASFQLDVLSMTASVTLVGYANEEAMNNKMQPIDRKMIQVPKADFDVLYAKHLPVLGADLYAVVKKKVEFKDAEVI